MEPVGHISYMVDIWVHMGVIWGSYGGHMGVIWGSYEAYGGLMVSYGDHIRGIWGLFKKCAPNLWIGSRLA